MHQGPQGYTRQQATTSNNPAHSNAWSYSTFFDSMYDQAFYGRAPARIGDAIDLGPMAPVFVRLRALAHQDREHGRLGFVNQSSRVLSFEPTQVGTSDRIVLEYTTSATKRAAIMLHTHPREAGTMRSIEHFSEVDLLSFVQAPHLLARVVVTPRFALMLVKTHLTELVPKASRSQRIADLAREAIRLACSPGDAPRIATKLAAIEFGMSLFLIDPSKEALIAQKVSLGS